MLLATAGLLGLALGGCGVAIGDACNTSYDCSTSGMTCDLTAPDGYCLKEGCWQDSDCPDQGVCVEFVNDDRYCMATCSGDGDCRDGYECLTDAFGTDYCYVK